MLIRQVRQAASRFQDKFRDGHLDNCNRSELMTFNKLILATVIALPVLFAGCDRDDGPVEKAGAKVDNAIDKTGQKIEDAGDKIQDEVNR